MTQARVFVALSMMVAVVLFASMPARAADSNDFEAKLAKINAAGFVLLAQQGSKTEVVETAKEFDTLISSSNPPDFYLLHKKTGKKSKVKITYGSKKHPGEYVWEFYQWLVKTVGEK